MSNSDASTEATLNVIDATQTVIGDKKICLVKVTSNKNSLVQDVDKLRTLGILNSSFSDDYFENNPGVLITVMAFQSAAAATDGFFGAHQTAQSCKFEQYLGYTDDYGNDQSQLLFSYKFTRAIYTKINWDKFNAANISAVSLDFSLTPAMKAIVQLASQSNGND